MGLRAMHASKPLLGTIIPMLRGIEKASSSWKAGDPLVADTGELTVDTTDPDGILGIAAADASGVAGAEARYIPWIPGILFEANIASGASARSQQFVAYGLVRDGTTGAYCVDTSETSAVACVVVDFVDPIGTTQGRVIVMPLLSRAKFGD